MPLALLPPPPPSTREHTQHPCSGVEPHEGAETNKPEVLRPCKGCSQDTRPACMKPCIQSSA